MGVPIFDALIGAGSSLVGSILGYKGQREANDTNLQSVRETNQANLDLYREQFRDQYRLWQENNAYNSPVAQMDRLRQAGLNPALNMGSNPTGQAQAASVPAANAMQAGHVEPVLFNTSDIATNIAAIAGASKSSEEARGLALDNLYRNQWNIVQIQEKRSQIKRALQDVKKGSAEESLLRSQDYMLGLQARMFSETFDSQKQSFSLANQKTQAETQVLRQQQLTLAADESLKLSQAALNRINAQYQPSVLQSAIYETYARAQMEINSGVLSQKQASWYIVDMYKNALNAKGIKNSNELFEATKDIVLKQARMNLFNSEMKFASGLSGILGKPLNGIEKAFEGLLKK